MLGGEPEAPGWQPRAASPNLCCTSIQSPQPLDNSRKTKSSRWGLAHHPWLLNSQSTAGLGLQPFPSGPDIRDWRTLVRPQGLALNECLPWRSLLLSGTPATKRPRGGGGFDAGGGLRKDPRSPGQTYTLSPGPTRAESALGCPWFLFRAFAKSPLMPTRGRANSVACTGRSRSASASAGLRIVSARTLKVWEEPGIGVPGDLGNQLEAKLDKPKVVHYLCSKRTDSYFTLWLNLELLLPVIIDCWIDNIRLIYNKTSRATQFPDGVDVRVPGFGKTFSLEFLDPSKSSVGSYFHTMVESLVGWGYTRGEDVRGAPYDWRRAPNENGPYFLALREMIEEMHQLYGGPVVLVAHSMGNMYTLYFLQRQPQAWKDKYIRAFVSLGAPWGGVAKTLRVLASGDNNRIPVIGPLKIREQQRSAVSTSWLLPYNYTWSPKKVFVHTPTTNYTLQDYRRFFQDIGFEDGWLMRQDTEGLVAMVPPGVPLHCLYGTGVPTPDSFYYESFPDRDPKICFGDGDGTVNLESALQCLTWLGSQEHQVSLQELPGSEHIEMLANATTLAYLKRVLLGP